MKPRSSAIVIKDNQVLLMHRLKNGREFYVFPGGGVETNETNDQAAIREVKEETNLDIKIIKLAYHFFYNDGSEQIVFLAQYISGEVMLPETSNEFASINENNSYQPLWIDVSKIKNLPLVPISIKNRFLADYPNFDNLPRTHHLEIDNRQ